MPPRQRSPRRRAELLAELEAVQAEMLRRRGGPRTVDVSRFRTFLEHPDFCGLSLSPVMGAIVDAADGVRPTTIDDETARRHFGCALDGLPRSPRRTIGVRAGGRGGKTSRLLAPKALHAAWTVPLPTVRTGEVASALLVAPDLKLARQALSFVSGYVQDSRIMRPALVSENKDAIELRRPHDKKIVRVEVLAASRRGRATRGRTLVFAGLDEACFFYDEESGVVNDADLYRAVMQRVVPEGQVWVGSTPWIAKVGLLEDLIEKNMGTHRHALVVTAGTRVLNPTWDPTGEIEQTLRDQDPDAARREIDGLPISGGSDVFFDPLILDAAIDKDLVMPRLPVPKEQVTAGGDFGFRVNASALAIVHRDAYFYRLAELLELRPEGEPLKPSVVVQTFAERLQAHGIGYLVADEHYRESITEHLATSQLGFKPAPAVPADAYVKARQLMREGRVKLPNNPRLLAKLRAVRYRPNPGGSISIILPLAKDGTHCDIVSALVLALYEACGIEVPPPPPEPGTPEYYAIEEARMLEQAQRRLEDSRTSPWWAQ